MVLAAVRDCPMALEHASELLRRDRDFVTMAMRISVRAAGGLSQVWGWGDGGGWGDWGKMVGTLSKNEGLIWKMLEDLAFLTGFLMSGVIQRFQTAGQIQH